MSFASDRPGHADEDFRKTESQVSHAFAREEKVRRGSR